MRINLQPKNLEYFDNIHTTIDNFQIVDKVFPSLFQSFDNRYINNLQSYTDGSRINVNIYQIAFNRCYSSQTLAYQRDYLIKTGNIQVIQVDFLFDTFFYFECFRKDYVDFWKDCNIRVIKPYFGSTSRSYDMGYHSFNSLMTSFLVSVVNALDTHQIMIEMRDNKMILAYGIDEISSANTQIAFDNFLNAVYHFMKVNGGRQNFILPEAIDENLVKYNMVDDYHKIGRKFKTKKKKAYRQELPWR